ncbi:nonstructural protein [Sigmofec virus UA08Rod_5894]|uniref:Nonstructural protein n=1 Tax=Sigmofec virus UA08Rod_5894 TaxID=2929443 RepID=A0A976N0L0_9VIRU|nr:nonstructural protein [Sigmofec virus UA08Rod_5894]
MDTNLAVAVRNFDHVIGNRDLVYFTHPSDFSLYHVADFDTDSGRVLPVDPPEFLADAASLLRARDKEVSS